MHSKSLQMLSIVFIIFMLCPGNGLSLRDNSYNMVTYTPLAHGNTHTTKALLNAWSSACKNTKGGKVSVPAGTYLLNTVEFKGPCKGPIAFEVSGTLKAPSDASNGEIDYWILFSNVNGLTISGTGTFDGQGQATWSNCKKKSCGDRPASLKLDSVNNANIEGITSINSKFFHLNLDKCDTVNIHQVKITAPGNSPNTDGIHIANSNNVQVSHVPIATGDDCISIGPGSTIVNISHVDCGPGHGISIGSLGKYPNERPVKGVTVSDCTLSSTMNGLRIKTFSPSPRGIVSDITYQNIHVKNVENPIIIDQNYCPHGSCNGKKDNSQVKISKVKFINVKGISASEASVTLNCSKSAPCQGIVLDRLNLTYKDHKTPSKATCSNFSGTFNGHQVPARCTK